MISYADNWTQNSVTGKAVAALDLNELVPQESGILYILHF